jgi:glycosyltransferase involved in cell wall biosynthesis
MVVHAYYPLAEPRVEREAKAARDAGWDVDVIALRGAGEPRDELVDGVHVHRLPVRHVRGAGVGRMLVEYFLFTLLAAAAVLRLERPRFDVVHVHSPPDFLAAAALPAKMRRSRVLLDIHDLSPHMYRARFGDRAAGRVLARLLTIVERVAAAVADEVVTVHEPYRRELVAHGIPSDKVHVVMNAVDEALLPERAPARRDDSFTVAYHGTLTSWYGVDLVLDAVAALRHDVPSIDVRILGDGDARVELKAQAARLGIADRVSFSGGYVPIADALREVASASCGVIPNRPSLLNRFALSSKLFEYVALGIPVVVSRLETLEQHFSDEEVTFFEAGDPSSLVDALCWVAAHPQDAGRKAELASERARQYAWGVQRERYLSLLDR